MGVEESANTTMIDEIYEFSAPKFFDFINGETNDEMNIAENWFGTALSYAPSPFMPRIREGRSVKIETLCDFSEVEHTKKDEGASSLTEEEATGLQSEDVASAETRVENKACLYEEGKGISITKEIVVTTKPCSENGGHCIQEKQIGTVREVAAKENTKPVEVMTTTEVYVVQGPEVCTPQPQMVKQKDDPQLLTGLKKTQTAKKIASLVRNPSTLKPKNQSQLSQTKSENRSIARSAMTAKKTVRTPDFAQENQAIKRQKLDGGQSRQILNVKPQNLPHNKSRLGLTSGATNKCPSTSKPRKEDRKANTASKPKLTLTRPKEPDLETSHRARSVRVKSSAELEEEMMANIPKFKARPVNKKMLEASTLPALPRSTPQLPEFQEFHLKTTERANQNVETSSIVSSIESSYRNHWNPHKLTEPKPPRLETLLRARPPKVKSSQELEQEELEKIPKFKARPLNKRIFESKGDLGIFCNPKRQATRPQEFHFATDERIPPSKSVTDLFDKLSLHSESRHDHQIPRITTPSPFHLSTEERGAEKERKLVVEILQKQLEEEQARIPKATPYPYTTDYPVIPPKPEPKQCTKPEPFQLESLVRHEEEMQREMEERQRMEKEETQMRKFKAQPILKDDPLPVPEKERKPLTQVEEFALHVDHRAVDRAEFDKKVKEKETIYKKYREEYESAKMMEEEKALKQLRKTLVPHARPVPNFDSPFLPQKSLKETTKAKSPKLRVLQRKQRRTSVAASHMR
ncbi:hypothetical protein IFM89_027213 [Coptis chinensis]|uniref:Targeting protein for Xklp2 n=1 Tax=Coptis chinensis TaxID=261450 RepID=A0A835GY85_9MAGN|nr:hypothetical protein IFM89_027213 [Coptis chinensis]